MRTTGRGIVIHIVLPDAKGKNFVLSHATKNKHFVKSGIIYVRTSLSTVCRGYKDTLFVSHECDWRRLFIALKRCVSFLNLIYCRQPIHLLAYTTTDYVCERCSLEGRFSNFVS